MSATDTQPGENLHGDVIHATAALSTEADPA